MRYVLLTFVHFLSFFLVVIVRGKVFLKQMCMKAIKQIQELIYHMDVQRCRLN